LPLVCLGQQKQVSHKEALEKKIECLTCHAQQKHSTSLSDARRGKVLKDFSHFRHLSFGNLAPVIAGAIDRREYLGSPNKIDILKLRGDLITDNPCQACHRGLASQTGAITKEHFPHMEDCLVCHSKVDAPFSCTQCHPPTLNLKPANHAPDFLDRHTTGKLNLDKTTCAACHGKRFTCLGCH
jgi:nitrate reductase cytochrome c-type subunit